MQFGLALQFYDAACPLGFDADGGAEMAQHVFAVVAGCLWFLDAGDAGGIQAGKQQGGLHLGGRDGHAVVQRHRVSRAFDRQWQAATFTGGKAGAAGRERIGHAPHRAAAQAGISGHDGE